ncbi:MAG: PQQ-binding-like beta-propeller repeat protein, partial [Clostridia bacterium]|nr:PQQ-binding-like beta-propeller repeat protein [Clostridia bacterium]
MLASLVVLGGLGTGIYFGVTTIPTSGIVVEEGTNTPVANVSVTNGRHVVKTDKDGKFELKGWHKARFVAITNPSGYWTEDYYKEISRKTKEYKFTLEKLEIDQTNHTFLQVTDTEINENGVGEWFEHIDKLVKETNPAFIIHTGDICYEAGLKQHIKDLNSETFGVPVRYTIGNHDFVDGKYGERLFEDVYGPVNYSFDVGDIHYIVSSLAYGDRLPKYTAGDVIKWMKADLENVADGKKVVIFNHDVCSDETGFVMKSGATKLDLKKEDVIAWINGHLHYGFVNDYNGILNISTPALIGGIDGSIGGVRIINVESNKIANIEMSYTDYIPEPSDEGYDWQTQLIGNNLYADPVLVGDKLYVATMDNNYPREPVVACIDINAENEEDRIIWTFNPKNSVKNNFYVNNGVVVVQDAEGYVYGLDANDGKKKWEKDLGLITYRYAMNGIVGEGDKVYCGNQRKVVCLNAKTGSEIWKYETNTGESSAFKMQILDNKLIMGSNWKYLFALNKDNGKLLWQSKDWIYTQQSAFMYKGNIYSLDSSNVWK